MGISLTTGKRNVHLPKQKIHFYSTSLSTAFFQANYLGLREVLHSRTYRMSQSACHSRMRFRRRLSNVGPTVVFKLENIEQANDYLMVYCRTGPTISTLAYTFVLPSLQFSASVGNINISLAYTGLPDGL